MEIQPGTRLGPYEVVSAVGAGGMGQVWRGRDTRLEREIAIKVLPPDFSGNAALQARFEREAKTISSLNHPHICTLHDVGHEQGTHFLVMEMIEGESLADRLSKGRLPMDQVLRIGGQVAEALDAAHRRGIVHRDLKPGNVMLTKSGAKLLDFGLAKTGSSVVVGVDGLTGMATEARPLTQEGTLLGTFQYMAPEQLEGLEADARTDIFALGALLYEMATGRRAFDGKTRTSLIASIVSGTPRPVSELVPMTPPAFEHVVRRCLEKDRDDRWQSAHDIADQLRWIAEAGSQAGVPAPLARRRISRDRALAIALAVALAAVAVLTVRELRRADTTAPAFRLTVPSITSAYRRADLAVISPDGTTVAFPAMNDEYQTRLWVRRLDSFEARPLEGTEGVLSFCWSPDSRALAFTARGKLFRVPADGGPVQALADTRGVVEQGGLTWGASGHILIGSRAGIQKVPAAGGALQPITTPDKARFEIGHAMPVFLSDGNRFFFISSVRDPKAVENPRLLYLGALDGSAPREVGPITSLVVPDEAGGHLMFVRDGTLLVSKFDFSEEKFEGEPVAILDEVSFFEPTGRADVSLSRNGILTAQGVVGGGRLAWLDLAGRPLGGVQEVAVSNQFKFSPDGARIFAAVLDPKIGTFDLFAFDTAHGGGSRLTYGRAWEAQPVPSRDGTRLFYAGDRLGAPDIMQKVLDSPEEDGVFIAEGGQQFPLDVSPDGSLLLFQSNSDPASGWDLWVAPVADGSKPRLLVRSPYNEAAGRFSPDGRSVAYVSNESGSNQVYVRPFPGPGAARQVSREGGVDPRWARDGSALFFRSGNRMMRSAAPFTADAEVLFENRDVVSFELAPDGKRILAVLTSDLDASPPTRVVTDWRSLLPAK